MENQGQCLFQIEVPRSWSFDMAVREWQADFRNFTAMSKLHDRGTHPQIQKGDGLDAESCPIGRASGP